GGHPQRRRGGCHDPECRLQRALGQHLLARQLLLSRRCAAEPRLRVSPGQPARGRGAGNVPAEPRLPRLLLPGPLHSGRDGDRSVSRRVLRNHAAGSLSAERERQHGPPRIRPGHRLLRLGHPLHAGEDAGRARAPIQGHGLHVRRRYCPGAEDPATRGGAAGAFPRLTTASSCSCGWLCAPAPWEISPHGWQLSTWIVVCPMSKCSHSRASRSRTTCSASPSGQSSSTTCTLSAVCSDESAHTCRSCMLVTRSVRLISAVTAPRSISRGVPSRSRFTASRTILRAPIPISTAIA